MIAPEQVAEVHVSKTGHPVPDPVMHWVQSSGDGQQSLFRATCHSPVELMVAPALTEPEPPPQQHVKYVPLQGRTLGPQPVTGSGIVMLTTVELNEFVCV